MSVDIVNLIESNPITKFNGDYQSKLIENVKKSFTDYEQQIFLASFYCYLKYDYKNDFVIDLDNVWKWLGFSQKYNAKCLLEKQFIINNDYKIFAPEASGAKKEIRGGHNKEIIMLNVDTFKKFCLKAGTKKADEIHDYFIKLENIMLEITKEESDELKLQLEHQKTEMQSLQEKNKIEYETKLEKQKVLEREKILLKEYATISCIFYIIKVKTYDNGHYVIKIGESRRGIVDRYKEHKSKYEECLLLDCFLVKNSKDFETFIKEHDSIRGNKVKDLIGHETELELFLVGNKLSYQMLLKIINHNIKYFNNNDTSKLELENEQLKLMIELNKSSSHSNPSNNNLYINELTETIKQLVSRMDDMEKTNKEILEKLIASQTNLVTGFNQQLQTLGPRLQKINPETLELVKVFETVTEAMKEDRNIKRPTINKAVSENTVYCGFRWALVDRELDQNIIHNILPTKQINVQNVGYIAQINKEKTDIVNVFLDRKTACQMNGYSSSSALDTPVKNFTLSKDFYYKLYEDCNSDLKKAFVQKNNGSPPLLYKSGIGQYDSANNLIKEFVCKYDCIKQLAISDKTLAKALDKNIMYKNCYFRTIGSKVKCF
jgi:hypothetical protein